MNVLLIKCLFNVVIAVRSYQAGVGQNSQEKKKRFHEITSLLCFLGKN